MELQGSKKVHECVQNVQQQLFSFFFLQRVHVATKAWLMVLRLRLGSKSTWLKSGEDCGLD